MLVIANLLLMGPNPQNSLGVTMDAPFSLPHQALRLPPSACRGDCRIDRIWR